MAEKANGPRRSRGFVGVLSSAGVGVAALVAGIVLIPIIIHSVSAESYGVWLVISAVAQYLNYSDLGVGAAIVHFGSRARAGGEERSLGDFLQAGLIWNAMALAIVLPVFFVFAWLYVSSTGAQNALESGEAVPLLIIGIVMVLMLLLKPYGAALTGAGLLPLERSNQGVGVLARIVMTLVACLVFQSITLVAVAETLAVVVPALLSLVAVRRRKIAVMHWSGFPSATLKYMLGYSVRSFSVNAVGALLLQSGTIAAAIALRPQDVTYYNAAFRIYSSVRQLIGWTNDPFRPALSRLSVGSPAAASNALLSLSFVTLALSAVGCGTLIIASTDIVELWLGTQVPVGAIAAALVILLAGLTFNAVHLPLIPAADAAGRPGVFLMPQVVWLILTVVGSVILGFMAGLPGIAAGFTLPLLLVEPYYLLKGSRTLGFPLRRWFTAVALPVAVIVGGAAVGAALVLATMAILRSEPSGIGVAVGFVVSACLTTLLTRKWLPLSSFVALGRLEL